MSDRDDFLRRLFRARPGPGDLGASQATADQSEPGRSRASEPAVDLRQTGPAVPGGYVPPGIPPGLPRVAGDQTSNLVEKELRYPRIRGQWEKKVLVIGGSSATPTVSGLSEFETSFPIRSLRVDNWSPQYVLVRGPEVYIPPNTFGAIVPMAGAPQSVRVIIESPPTVTQPAQAAGSVVHLWPFEDELEPNPGEVLPGSGAQTVADSGIGGQVPFTNAQASDSHIYGFNGGTWYPAQINTPSDGQATAGFPALETEAFGMLFNGASYDRLRSVSSVGDGLGVAQAMQPSSDNPPASVSGANAAASIVFGAVAGQTHRLTMLIVSYSGGAVAGRLTVNDGTNNIIDVDIVATGPVSIPLPPGGLSGRAGAALTCTLAAGGVGVTGKISAAKLTA